MYKYLCYKIAILWEFCVTLSSWPSSWRGAAPISQFYRLWLFVILCCIKCVMWMNGIVLFLPTSETHTNAHPPTLWPFKDRTWLNFVRFNLLFSMHFDYCHTSRYLVDIGINAETFTGFLIRNHGWLSINIPRFIRLYSSRVYVWIYFDYKWMRMIITSFQQL